VYVQIIKDMYEYESKEWMWKNRTRCPLIFSIETVQACWVLPVLVMNNIIKDMSEVWRWFSVGERKPERSEGKRLKINRSKIEAIMFEESNQRIYMAEHVKMINDT